MFQFDLQSMLGSLLEEDDEEQQREGDIAAVVAHRRTLAAAAQRRRNGKKRRPRSIFYWEDHDHRLSQRQFKLRYRLTRESFSKLHGMLLPHIKTKNVLQARRSRAGGCVDSRVRLAVALRYMAGAMMNDLCLIYHITITECFRSLWRVVDAVHEHPELDINSDWVDNPAALARLEADFAEAHRRRYGSASWRGQVGAIDGCDFDMRNPGKSVVNPMRYFVERKGHYQMLCTAICDSQRRFLFYDMSYEACTHDSLAWAGTKLGSRIEEALSAHGRGYFLNGDNAYVLSNTMITPGGGDDFDFYQSSNRMAIECAFGILIRRWGVLWRPLEVAMQRRAPLIGALMKLHNFCINERISVELRSAGCLCEINPKTWAPSPLFGSNGEPLENLDTFDHSAAGGGRGTRRSMLAAALSDSCLKRPGVSSYRAPLPRS